MNTKLRAVAAVIAGTAVLASACSLPGSQGDSGAMRWESSDEGAEQASEAATDNAPPPASDAPAGPVDGAEVALAQDSWSLADGGTAIDVSWQATSAGNPVTGSNCTGFYTVEDPEGERVDLGNITDTCSGEDEIQLDADSPAGEWQISVTINGHEDTAGLTVTP